MPSPQPKRIPLQVYRLLVNPALILCQASRMEARGLLEGGSMVTERRKGERVTFERGIGAHMMGIDGTWRRQCTMEDVSENGSKLTVEASLEGMHLIDVIPLLSST